MQRKAWRTGLVVVAALIALVALGPQPPPARAAGSYMYDFEQTLQPWQPGVGSILTLDKGDNLCPMNLGTGMALLTAPVLAPNAYTNDHVYMIGSFPVGPTDSVIVHWVVKPQTVCEGTCIPEAYIGPSSVPGTRDWVQPIGQKGPDGWLAYNYKLPVSGVQQSIRPAKWYVALGVQRVGGPLRAIAMGVDCVQVRIVANTQ